MTKPQPLKPCPFCGGKAKLRILPPYPAYVECRRCEIVIYRQRAGNAVKAWNRRAK
jgi:hypothetical protein